MVNRDGIGCAIPHLFLDLFACLDFPPGNGLFINCSRMQSDSRFRKELPAALRDWTVDDVQRFRSYVSAPSVECLGPLSLDVEGVYEDY